MSDAPPIVGSDHAGRAALGFSIARGVLARDRATALVRSFEARLASGSFGVALGRRLLALDNATQVVPELQALLDSSVFTPLAEGAIMIGCQVVIKPGRCPDHVYWHRDLEYASSSRRDGLTFWLALTDVTVDNGCLWYLPGSHRQDYELDPQPAAPVPVPMSVGDLAIHTRATLHRSGPNRSPNPRYALMLEWLPVDERA